MSNEAKRIVRPERPEHSNGGNQPSRWYLFSDMQTKGRVSTYALPTF